jgi:hypothetical protein
MVDETEAHAPYMVTPPTQREGMLPAIARAIVSLTLLAVLLLAFGAALAGWFWRGQWREQLAEEIARTPPQAQLVVEYRDEIEAISRQMETERSQAPPPNIAEIYARMMEKRGAASVEWRESFNVQSEIDLLVRDNNDLRWVNEQMRARAENARNPRLPRDNAPP